MNLFQKKHLKKKFLIKYLKDASESFDNDEDIFGKLLYESMLFE